MYFISFTKIIQNFKYSILFYVVSFIIVFLCLIKILHLCNLELRQYIYDFLFYIITTSLIIGVIQILFKLKNRIIKTIAIVLCILVIFILFNAYQFMRIFDPYEEVIQKENLKYIAKVSSFLHTYADFHKYINPFVFKKEIEIQKNF